MNVCKFNQLNVDVLSDPSANNSVNDNTVTLIMTEDNSS